MKPFFVFVFAFFFCYELREKKPHKKTNNEELGASKAQVQLWAPHHYDELERDRTRKKLERETYYRVNEFKHLMFLPFIILTTYHQHFLIHSRNKFTIYIPFERFFHFYLRLIRISN